MGPRLSSVGIKNLRAKGRKRPEDAEIIGRKVKVAFGENP